MRERVAAVRSAAAEPDQWFGPDEIADSFDFSGVGDMGDTGADAEYIASWHPAVALAVADWLDSMAARAESKLARGGDQTAVWSHEKHALAVARAYLGEVAP